MLGRTALHYVHVLSGRELPQTQTTNAERAILVSHLPGRKQIIEIGVFEGFTTRLLAEFSDSDALVYGVDPFFRGRLGVSWGLKIARYYNRHFLRSGKLKLVRTFSTEVENAVPSSVDFVFIDGDHAHDAITADWAFWSNRLQSGGVIALHDVLSPVDKTQAPEFGSHQYFYAHIRNDRRFAIIDQQDSLAILRKI
jgi:predicted O-methyltransferase YrrM